MEIPTHSRQPNMVSKKSCNGVTTTTSKSIYDDVFGGPPKFGAPTLSPRIEDYGEIFGGFHTSRASSIPVLDLPLVDDEATGVFFDVRCSDFDYTEVFGGFSGHDFAVSYEDLMLMMEQSNGHDDSSDDAWTPAEADNLSEESDYFTKDQRLSNGDSSESIGGCTEFNISYNKASKKCDEDLSNGIRHTTQLHDVSGNTFVVDRATSLPNSDYLCARDDDDHPVIDYSGEMLSRRHLKKALSQPANFSDDGLFFGDDVANHREFIRNGSMFLTISDVNLRTRPSELPPPSRPPPALDVDKSTPNCINVASEESAGDSSPPYFDVEVDASSSAAASAAAMKDAMKKAQAKLKSAKESMERKREAFHSRTKSDSRIGRRNKEEKATKLGNGSGSIKGDRGGQGNIQRGVDSGIEFSVMEESQKVTTTSWMMSDPLEGNYHLNIAKKSAAENKGRESFSSQGSDFIDVAGEWKEATQFYELVSNKSKQTSDQENDKTVVEHDSICYELQKKEERVIEEGLWGHQENRGKVGADRELEHLEIKSGILIRSLDSYKSFERADVANKQMLLDKRVQMTEEACGEERNEKKFSIDLEYRENEKRKIRADDSQKHSDSVEVMEKVSGQTLKRKDKVSQWKENNTSMGNVKKFPDGKEGGDRKSTYAFKLDENEKKFNATFELAGNEIRLDRVTLLEEKEKTKKAVREREENEKTSRQASERKDSERRRKEALEKDGNDRRLKDNRENEERLRRQREREENGKRQKETCEREENEKRQRELLERETNEKRLKEAKDKEGYGRRQNENLEKEERQMRQRKTTEQEENAKRDKEENEKRLKQALEMEEIQRMREAIEKEENAKRERKENEKRLKQALEKEEMQRRQIEAAEQDNAEREREENEMRLKEALDKEENERRQKAAVHRRKNEKKQEQASVAEEYAKQQLEASKMRCKDAFQREVIAERIKETYKSGTGEKLEGVYRKPVNVTTSRYLGEVEVTETELKADKEPERVRNMSETKCMWKETETKLENQTILQMGEDYIELNQAWRLDNNEIDRTTKIRSKDENRREPEPAKEIAREETSKLLSDPRNGEEEAASGTVQDTVKRDKMLSGVGDVTGTEQKTDEKIKGYIQVNLDSGNQGVKFSYDSNERGKNNENLNREHDNLNFMSAGVVKEPFETGRKMKGAQPATEAKGSNQRAAQQVHASHSTDKNVKNDSFTEEDRESERTKREMDSELERLRKMEEEREREREREKDRMAVESTILETRERVYAEARERTERAAVERATAEVRQRALNDARERLEKACAEAREKSFPDSKASIEARLRAERAAVERATAEARERAFEKAMAERTAFEARERVERSASDKFSASSRNSGIRPNSSSNELQSLGAGMSNGAKYQYSSVYSERFGVEGESPQRCKARLERHQRTAERAANALEELNMRNLHAQREQAERNRLAENLDADVKRWSSGKEGNLRALLSTLQYILGPDSGWHPIPLTEVITAAAVKKAYRKATLCVHPDKLQQRGASIQQKYICEKVFDLLKEAWNKFNSEER